MEINILLLLSLVLYSIIVSQPLLYIVALRNVQLNLQPSSYIEMRKLLDKNFQAKFRLVVYAALVSCSLFTLLCSLNPTGWLFRSAAIALTALIMDCIIAVKGNIPINKIINTWSAENYPENWKAYRDRWLSIFLVRQVLVITGFLSLLIVAVFE